ncbi:amino acid adenylation domain-containing protein [Xenorhabdus eapokensis]|uniref:Putative non-ribosomal peptide synthase n=1 Tax=Xenorhabdus eapokensis TaxID=1873482 RepID=A0A1Q5TTB1_9GAMM|nr:amino acid adenylation domain-containing protein [Xenorhabdus eapokensis]OKP03472.1 putative non-ribosomal peptide synthase [Xenorhabdus eapokensis]
MIATVLKEQTESSIDLAKYLDDSVLRYPEACAVIGSDDSTMSYKELSDAADNIAAFLYQKGVVMGDRVGIFMRKKPQTLAAIFGVLRLGAVYVPTDVDSSALRALTVFDNCNVRCILTDPESASYLIQVAPHFKSHIIVIQAPEEEISEALQALDVLSTENNEEEPNYPRGRPDADQPAYILYTSGSSGIPKGVVISHRNSVSFVEWASAFFKVTAKDQISSHAPFHFDLSIFDIYVSVKNGACIHLIDTDLAASPRHLATFIASREITIWYSAPAILGILAEQRQKGHIPNQLRLVLFAGEVFPITKLRKLVQLWPEVDYFNLYGPTETNVCTVYQVPVPILENRLEPLSIGHPCTHCETIVVNEHLQPVPEGESGQLCVSGDSVFAGYWNDPEKTAQRIFYLNGKDWYNTGDVVRSSAEGYIFMGRLDRMIKRHGYRIELDEIESCLRTHPKLSDSAVISTEIDGEVTITAFLVPYDLQLSLAELNQYCHKRIARYMIPDHFSYLPELPRTSTGKTNYQFLKQQFLEQQSHDKSN